MCNDPLMYVNIIVSTIIFVSGGLAEKLGVFRDDFQQSWQLPRYIHVHVHIHILNTVLGFM